MKRLRDPISNERGAALLATLAMITVVLMVGVSILSLGTAESEVVGHTLDGSRSFYVAEGGVERAWTWLEQSAQNDPPSYPVEQDFLAQGLADGVYDVHIERLASPSVWAVEYEVTSTAEVDGVVREIRAILQHETFAKYMYFADQMENIWFVTGDSLDGRVHANGFIRTSGSPWFGMKVTTAQDHFIMADGSEPVFEQGYELGVPEIPLPITSDLIDSFETLAGDGGLDMGSLSGRRAKYEVELGREGLGTFSYRSYERSGWSYSWSDWTLVDLSDINGIAWFDERVDLSGVLDGQLTVGSADDIYIVDDITYEGSSPTQGPLPGCDDVLGIASGGNVIVGRTTPNLDDCVIHAHIMALNESFTVEGYNEGAPRGDLVLYGGFAQKRQGAVGTFTWGNVINHGYSKDYHYDVNLLTNAPPGYPPTGKYNLVLWEEVMTPGA